MITIAVNLAKLIEDAVNCKFIVQIDKNFSFTIFLINTIVCSCICPLSSMKSRIGHTIVYQLQLKIHDNNCPYCSHNWFHYFQFQSGELMTFRSSNISFMMISLQVHLIIIIEILINHGDYFNHKHRELIRPIVVTNSKHKLLLLMKAMERQSLKTVISLSCCW